MHVLAVARLKSLWISLCTTHVTARGIPFPNNDWIHQMPAPELEITRELALDRDRRLSSGFLHDGYTSMQGLSRLAGGLQFTHLRSPLRS